MAAEKPGWDRFQNGKANHQFFVHLKFHICQMKTIAALNSHRKHDSVRIRCFLLTIPWCSNIVWKQETVTRVSKELSRPCVCSNRWHFSLEYQTLLNWHKAKVGQMISRVHISCEVLWTILMFTAFYLLYFISFKKTTQMETNRINFKICIFKILTLSILEIEFKLIKTDKYIQRQVVNMFY